MRVVLDTNVLVSGLLSESGVPGWIVDLVLSGELEPAVDERVLGEYREVLARPELELPQDEVRTLLAALERLSVRRTPSPWPHPLPDPDDEPFLAVAAAAEAVLVTGNLRHFPETAREGVQVLSPREMLDLVRRAGRE